MITPVLDPLLVLSLVILGGTNMGADHEPGSLTPQPGWPSGFHAAVNQRHRVHGFWVNTTDVFFYRSSNEDLNNMLAALSRIKGVETNVVLHAGTGVAKSPWGTGPADQAANWRVKLFNKKGFGKQNRITVDVWVGSGIELSKLAIPQHLTVSNGNEIESFIKNRSESPIDR